MKTVLNFIGLAGFAALNYGVYLYWGAAITLMFAGASSLLFSMRALKVGKGQ